MKKAAVYCFNVEDAKKYGAEEAILLYNIRFWVNQNKKKESRVNLHEGRYWTFNSARAFTELFPFWTEKQLRRIAKSLVKKGALLVGRFNRFAYDKTKWYTLADDSSRAFFDSKSHCPNGQMDVPDQADGCDQTGEPIPDVNTKYKTQDINSSSTSGDLKSGHLSFQEKENSLLAKENIDPLVEKLTQDEMLSLAETRHLDEYDQGFLSDICGVPVEELTSKQIKRLEKIRKKAANSKKMDERRPVDQEELDYRYKQHLQRETALGKLRVLDDQELEDFAYQYNLVPGTTETCDSLRKRCEIAVRLEYED